LKKLFTLAALAALLGIGGLLIYLEASAIDLPCEQAEMWCADCQGGFSIDYCWDGGQHIYCYFWCTDFSQNCWHWSWPGPVYQICTLT
jgi:hypothetical protein